MTQPLVTAEQQAQLLAVGAARAAGRSIDPMPAVRLFTPDAHATWLLGALEPADGDTAWGLGNRHARPGPCEAVRSSVHRRAAQATCDARSLLPAGAAAVGVPASGRGKNGSITD